MIKTILGLCAAGALLVSCAHTNEGGWRKPSQSGPTLMGAGTEYKVMFTDPLCDRYEYTDTMKSNNGTELKSKPKNVFCKSMYDLKRSGERSESPQAQLVAWTKDAEVKHIIFTYLSFRNKAVKEALCERVKGSNPIKVTFVMSSSEDTAAADYVKDCNPAQVEYKTRGLEGGLGYAHNKIYIVLKKVIDTARADWRGQIGSSDSFRMAFSSGNMTSGPVMHHENWHFITTNGGKHFSQMHMCVMQSEWNDSSGVERDAYMAAIRACREDLIAKGNFEETDIKAFFVPGEGENKTGSKRHLMDNEMEGQSAANHMLDGDGVNPGIRRADKIWIGAHRFFYSKMIKALQDRMASSNRPEIKIIVDDDTYYKAMDDNFGLGDTDPAEWYNIQDMVDLGAEARLMETNSEEHQLHHSKYLLFFRGSEPKALLCGAANLTGAGFKKNWENIYYITIPEVVKAFQVHYDKFWMSASAVPGAAGFSDKASTVDMLPPVGVVLDKLTDKGKPN